MCFKVLSLFLLLLPFLVVCSRVIWLFRSFFGVFVFVWLFVLWMCYSTFLFVGYVFFFCILVVSFLVEVFLYVVCFLVLCGCISILFV